MSFRLRVRRPVAVAGPLACVLALSAPPASAEELAWSEAWPRFRSSELLLTSALGGGIVAGLFVPQHDGSWSSGISVDAGVREMLRSRSDGARGRWVFWGDLAFFGLIFYPFVVDAGVVAAGVHGSSDVALQLALIDLQAVATSGFVSVLSQKLVGRKRPFVSECVTDPDYDPDCGDATARSQSFLSGHTAMAFTGAGLICVEHAHLPLYGRGIAGGVACGTALSGAGLVAVSRLVADRHYASDVLAGALIGGLSGFVLPAWWHFTRADPEPVGAVRWGVTPFARSDALGLALVGVQ